MGNSNDRINDFLEKAAIAVRSGNAVRVYIGNEASDLDSMASSVLYAYSRGTISDDLPNVPVMNIPREDFGLRTEAVWLFKEAGIDAGKLTFLDDFDLGKKIVSGRSKLVLVDHNKLSSAQAGWAAAVEEIVDHHTDEGLYPHARKTIAPVGSASTLVVESILSAGGALDASAATLALGTVLLDTVNLDPTAKRATSRDEAIVPKLLAISGADRSVLFDKLQFEKFNVSALSTKDILRKDYKEYRMGSYLCGISSALLPLGDWIRKDSNLEGSYRDYCAARKLDILIVMSAYTDPEFRRELALHTPDAALRRRIVDFLNTSGLGLKPLPTAREKSGTDTEYFSQADLGQSRKKLQPLLSEFLKN